MQAKYNTIGHNYNQTRRPDPYLTERLFQNLSPHSNGLYLDIGCGTGNYTNELQKKGIAFIGIDPSSKMLEKAKTLNPNIDWRIGTAEQTKLNDQSVDGIMGSLTIHHWTDLSLAFRELFRILKPKGKLVIFTATPEQMQGYWLNHYFPEMLKDSIAQMPDFGKVKNAMRAAGFEFTGTEKYFIHEDLIDQFLYCGKHQPELYLDPAIRNGISSFSALANIEEVKVGLQKLEADIKSGKIKEVIQSFENDLGDYLYINARKEAYSN